MEKRGLHLIDNLNQSLQSTDFKSCNFFTNSIINNFDTTHLIRDIQNDEILLFKGKTINQVDLEQEEQQQQQQQQMGDQQQQQHQQQQQRDSSSGFLINNNNDQNESEVARLLGLQLVDLVQDPLYSNSRSVDEDLVTLGKIQKRLQSFSKLYSIKQFNFQEITQLITEVKELQGIFNLQKSQLKELNEGGLNGPSLLSNDDNTIDLITGSGTGTSTRLEEYILREQKEIEQLEQEISVFERTN